MFDTDIFIDHFRGLQSASDYLKNIPEAQRATTDINVVELLKGRAFFAADGKKAENDE